MIETATQSGQGNDHMDSSKNPHHESVFQFQSSNNTDNTINNRARMLKRNEVMDANIKEIMNKPMSRLTVDDKKALYKHYRNELDNMFSQANDYALGFDEKDALKDDLKSFLYTLEEQGIDIGELG